MGPVFAAVLTLPGQVVLDLELILLLGGLGLLIAVGLVAVIEMRRRIHEEEEATPPQSLEEYQALRDQGLLDSQEFERIRAKLEGSAEPPVPPPPAAS